MSRNKKPRKAYRPRPVYANNMDIALHLAAKPAVADRAEILSSLREAIKALREGVATELQWSIAAGSLAVAFAVEDQGIVRGLRGHFEVAERALQTIYDRAIRTGGGRWIRVTLYFDELDALADLYTFHSFQVSKLGRAEFQEAVDAAQKATIAKGHAVVLVHDMERLAA